jgi:DNA polymerase III epsilon subunit-like protein
MVYMDSVEGQVPRIAFWDIEISPTTGTFWGSKYETNILEITHPWVILSFSWKEGKEFITKALPDYAGYKKGSLDDLNLVRELHGLMSRVDILVGQNGDQFDCKKLNARFAIHGLPPPAPYKTVDTLKVARQKFGFTSNKLDDLGETLGLGRKLEHEGYNLWRKCMDGDLKAWKKMKKYNKQDVVLLEKVYDRLLPYMTNHPNVGMWNQGTVCSKCGSKNLESRGFYRNKTTQYRRIQCHDCGSWMRTVVNERETKPLISI